MKKISIIIDRVLWCIYVTPLYYILFTIIAFIILWSVLALLSNNRFQQKWKRLNIIGFICSVVAIIYVTIADRSTGYRVSPDFIPFHFVIEAKEQVEMWRTALMNVFLFLPLGLTMPFAIKKKSIAYTLIFAIIFSVLIESSQYFFMLGQAEIDDVMCNVFGAFLGIIPFIATNKIRCKKSQ